MISENPRRAGRGAASAQVRGHVAGRTDFVDLFRLRFPRRGVLSVELFASLASANPDLRLERTAGGELEIMAPAGGEASNKNSEFNFRLVRWSKKKGSPRGVCFDSSGGFVLPDGAI